MILGLVVTFGSDRHALNVWLTLEFMRRIFDLGFGCIHVYSKFDDLHSCAHWKQ